LQAFDLIQCYVGYPGVSLPSSSLSWYSYSRNGTAARSNPHFNPVPFLLKPQWKSWRRYRGVVINLGECNRSFCGRCVLFSGGEGASLY